METKKLISSYDEANDIFVGKMSDKKGYYANYGIADGIFLNIDEDKLPVSVQINDASCVLNVNKSVLQDPNVSILIECAGNKIHFRLSIADREIFSSNSDNTFDIPEVGYEIRAS